LFVDLDLSQAGQPAKKSGGKVCVWAAATVVVTDGVRLIRRTGF
jgi:hypothetical protein